MSGQIAFFREGSLKELDVPLIPSAQPRNPHFDDDRIVWQDSYSGNYDAVPYDEQFDYQWKLYLERQPGFYAHTGVETSDAYIDDRIYELTGCEDFLLRKKWGRLAGVMKRLTGRDKRRERRGVGGRLYLEPKFPIGFFQDRHCLDVGCGSGRWTRALLALGASVKSIDASENSLRSTRRYNPNVERLDLFKIGGTRPDLHEAFDFTLCWGVIMCTHDPKLAFENVACTVKSGGFLYVMVYAPTYHASDFVLEARKHYHRRLLTAEERLDYVNELARHDSNNAINYMDMLNTYYNWTIDEGTLVQWCANNGFDYPSFLNAHEPHKCAHHAVARRR